MSRRLLQVMLLVLSLSLLGFGGLGMIKGAAWLGDGASINLDSHFRYLSGIFFGLGLALLTCVPRIERMSVRFRWVAALVFIGGLARLGGAIAVDTPGRGHMIGLGLELVVTPLLVVWQARLAARARR